MENVTNSKTICLKGELIDLSTPRVMGILNITPDSFYKESRTFEQDAIKRRIEEIFLQGGDFIDVGAYSSRPGADDVSAQEETDRLCRALDLIKQLYPDARVSVDTFRSRVADYCIDMYGPLIINDISGGEMDRNMFETIARHQVPYILMHMQGTPQTMQIAPQYTDLLQNIFLYFSEKIKQLRRLKVNDIILDPGFGFGKTLEDNYRLMAHLRDFELADLPIFVGVSRKSMIYKLLNSDPQCALNGTTILHTYALLHGASLLRVHDVQEAVECVKIVTKILSEY